MQTPTVYRTQLRGLERIHEGKVRDIYAVDADTMLIVTTRPAVGVRRGAARSDPGQGAGAATDLEFLVRAHTAHIVPNHLTGPARWPVSSRDPDERAMLDGPRRSIVRRLRALPIEAVVRGYLIGSGWKDYQKTGARLRHRAAAGTAAGGAAAAAAVHARLQGRRRASTTRTSPSPRSRGWSARRWRRRCATRRWRIYDFAAEHALERGIIIADTKFEFGVDEAGQLTLIDEVLTPDSSRFWPADTYRVGTSPPSFDKQFVRDYLETLDWDKKAPGPRLPPEIIARTSEKYREALAAADGRCGLMR